MKLGFVDLFPTYIYLDSNGYYFWDHKDKKPIPIAEKGFRGYLTGLELKDKTFRGKTSTKLGIAISTEDKDYVIQTGITSWFAKTILIRLNDLPVAAFQKPITIGIQHSKSKSRVVFGTTRPKIKLPENYDYSILVEERLIGLCADINNRIAPENNEY